MTTMFEMLGVDPRREGELVRTLGVDKIVRTEVAGGTAFRMWFREWTEECFIRDVDFDALLPSKRATYVADYLVMCASNVRAQGQNGRGFNPYGGGVPFKPSAALLLEVPQVIKTPMGRVPVDPPREDTADGRVLDEIAKVLGMQRWNSVFADEPDVEFEVRLRARCSVGTFAGRYEELRNAAAKKLYPGQQPANRFEAIAAELVRDDDD